MMNWYVLRIKYRHEPLSEKYLLGKGYEVFYPTFSEKRQSGSAAVIRQQPLFPGYLFCNVSPTAAGYMVTSPGVIGIVSFGKTPAVVPDEEIERVRRLVTTALPRQPWQYLPKGTMVRIESGPLHGLEGILLSELRARKLVISINLLQRSVAASLPDNTQISVRSSMINGITAHPDMRALPLAS